MDWWIVHCVCWNTISNSHRDFFLLFSLLKIEVWLLSCFSLVWFFETLWTAALQTSQSMGFSRQGYWSGLPFSSPGDLPDRGAEPVSLMSPALVGGFFTTSATWESSGGINSADTLLLDFRLLWMKDAARPGSKQRMLQLSNPASPEGTQEGEEQGPDPDS